VRIEMATPEWQQQPAQSRRWTLVIRETEPGVPIDLKDALRRSARIQKKKS
jgi:hypothetical protein